MLFVVLITTGLLPVLLTGGACKVENPSVYIPRGSTSVVTFDLGPRLENGETLTGTPAIEDVNSTGELSLTEAQVNSVEDLDNAIEIGKAAQFLISSTTTECKSYEIKITTSTTGTPAQTLVDRLDVIFI